MKLRQEIESSQTTSREAPTGDAWRLVANEAASTSTNVTSQPALSGSFSSVMCSENWRGSSGTGRDCLECATHLYANFRSVRV